MARFGFFPHLFHFTRIRFVLLSNLVACLLFYQSDYCMVTKMRNCKPVLNRRGTTQTSIKAQWAHRFNHALLTPLADCMLINQEVFDNLGHTNNFQVFTSLCSCFCM